jgi:hypothetical protein
MALDQGRKTAPGGPGDESSFAFLRFLGRVTNRPCFLLDLDGFILQISAAYTPNEESLHVIRPLAPISQLFGNPSTPWKSSLYVALRCLKLGVFELARFYAVCKLDYVAPLVKRMTEQKLDSALEKTTPMTMECWRRIIDQLDALGLELRESRHLHSVPKSELFQRGLSLTEAILALAEANLAPVEATLAQSIEATLASPQANKLALAQAKLAPPQANLAPAEAPVSSASYSSTVRIISFSGTGPSSASSAPVASSSSSLIRLITTEKFRLKEFVVEQGFRRRDSAISSTCC